MKFTIFVELGCICCTGVVGGGQVAVVHIAYTTQRVFPEQLHHMFKILVKCENAGRILVELLVHGVLGETR